MDGVPRLNRSTRLLPTARVALALAGVLLAAWCQAAPIQQRLANGLVANAEFNRGSTDHAVLVLHGFLATHQFPTITRIVTELSDQGYTVLAPTLTLGISNRVTSLPCNALHLHTFEDSSRELRWWVNWLGDQGYRDITLVGHSAGSIRILAYTLDDPHPAVRRQVLTSLVSLERLPGAKPTGTSTEQAEQWLAQGQQRVARYDVSFCHGNFTAPPAVYLSYHAWTRKRVAQALRDTRIPAVVIVGANDRRFTGGDWLQMLEASAPRLVVLNDANHFFDGMAEFALYDAIGQALQAGQRGETP